MKITVIGEFCTDVFVYGETKRLSPEAPVPVFNPLYVERNFGMAGNVVENLKSLKQDVWVKHIHQFQPVKKTRYVDDKSNHMFIRVDEGEETITPLELTDSVIDQIKESDAIIISDYNKGFLNEKLLLEVAYHSRFIVMDTKKRISPDLVSNFNFIKLNEHEYHNFSDDVKELYPNKLIVTLGSKGAKYMDKIYPSPDPRETIDVSGAGDTFTASFTVKYLETKNIEESIIYANEMASIVVQKRGVSVPIIRKNK
jgi:D-beta-D-heptose 7-phosphate kinase/D-beta-D-heptose 1-phosphate adenosyltransferase